MKRVFLLILLGIVTAVCWSQDKRTFRLMYREAESVLLYLDMHEEALKLYQELERMDPGNAHMLYKIGICYLHIPGKKEQAIPYLQKASLNTAEDFEPHFEESRAPLDVFFYLGLAYHVHNRFDEAIGAYQEFIEKADVNSYYRVVFVREQINGCIRARELVRNPVFFKKTELDRSINQEVQNFNPAVSADGRSMVYTIESGRGLRIMYTLRVKGAWMPPRDITGQLETGGDGISSSLTADGKTLFIYREDMGAGNLYVSYLRGGAWTAVEKLSRNINTKYWESSCCLSPDGNTLYFSSNRKGGYGRLDLYRSTRQANGDWGPAGNLGPEVNSPLDENNPQLSADGKTLFFSSQGHGSMGGFDHYYSLSTDRGKWSLPVNLGYPVNTSDDDLFLAPVGSGDTVFASLQGLLDPAGQNICELVLKGEKPRARAKVTPMLTLKGTAKLADGDERKDSSLLVHIMDTAGKKIVMSVVPDAKTGHYEVELPPGNYQVVIGANGYEKQAHLLAVSDRISKATVSLDARLVTEEVGDGKYWLTENIYFGYNSYRLEKEELFKLERLITLMKEYPGIRFELIGHTDTLGGPGYNTMLSSQRATSTARCLFDRGISRDRLVPRGAGEIIAVRKNNVKAGPEDPADQRYNRRVEIRILGPENAGEYSEEIYFPDLIRLKNDLKYTVLVIKTSEKLPDNHFDSYGVEELRYIREQTVGDGYIYTLGTFIEKPKAVEVLGKVRNAGFAQARILDQVEMADIVVGEDPDPGFFMQPGKITEVPWYTIQVLARRSMPRQGIIDTTELMVFRGTDGYYRFCFGRYQGYSKAREALPEVREKWFRDAFIQELRRLEQGLPDGPDLR